MKLYVKEHSIYYIVEMFCFLHVIDVKIVVTRDPWSGSNTHVMREIYIITFDSICATFMKLFSLYAYCHSIHDSSREPNDRDIAKPGKHNFRIRTL